MKLTQKFLGGFSLVAALPVLAMDAYANEKLLEANVDNFKRVESDLYFAKLACSYLTAFR